jgi:hypothetical protein
MQGTCFYCQKETLVGELENPYTHETHLTCEECKYKLLTDRWERKLNARFAWFDTSILLVLSIIFFVFVNWQIGLVFVIAAAAVGLISYARLKHNLDKRVRELGRSVDVKRSNE